MTARRSMRLLLKTVRNRGTDRNYRSINIYFSIYIDAFYDRGSTFPLKCFLSDGVP